MNTNYNNHFSNSLKTFFKSKFDLEINTFEFHLQKCAPRSRNTCRAPHETFVVVGFPKEKLHFLHIIQRHQRIKLLKCFTG